MAQPQYLVITAIGTDRTGIVGDLTQLVHDCCCNILDSRMAIFGQEFTFIMLLSGDRMAISKVENSLPSTSHKLGLSTMMKRTSRHQALTVSKSFAIEYVGPDIPGTLSKVTRYLAEQHVDISSLKADAFHDSNDQTSKHATCLTIQLSKEANVDQFTTDFKNLCITLEQDLSMTQLM
jgi:glycine cleavage system transcriptional repressor